MSPTRMISEHKWIYLGAIVVLVVLAVVGLITYTQQKATTEARLKAQELSDILAAKGFRRFDTDNIALALGTDGGAVCTDPNSALKRGLWLTQMSNGAGGPGMRPIIADSRILEAGAEVIRVYCPDKLADYQEKIDDLKTADLVND